MSYPAPLQGVKVLDLSRILAGPWCTQLLGDLGADVVKVEAPQRGDDSRQYGAALGDAPPGTARDSAFFLACNRNKRSIALDLGHAADLALVKRMAAECDVLVENFKAGGLVRFGLDAATLRAQNPRLIYCSVTGFGQDGPYAERPAYDFVMQAMAGLMSSCGQPEGAPGSMPMRTGIPTTDLVTGYQAAIAILGALIQRGISGQGQFIDAAMLDASVGFNVHIAQGYLLNQVIPQRQGNDNPIASPSGVFAASDGWMVVAAGNDRQFAALCGVLQQPELVQEPRFAINGARVQNRAALHQVIEPLFKARPAQQWLTLFTQAQVPCAPINDMSQVFADPQVRHRDMLKTVPHGSGLPLTLMRSTLNMSAHDAPLRAPPTLGQHSEEILQHWLGMDEAQAEQACKSAKAQAVLAQGATKS